MKNEKCQGVAAESVTSNLNALSGPLDGKVIITSGVSISCYKDRDSLSDAHENALALVAYLGQCIAERKGK